MTQLLAARLCVYDDLRDGPRPYPCNWVPGCRRTIATLDGLRGRLVCRGVVGAMATVVVCSVQESLNNECRSH